MSTQYPIATGDCAAPASNDAPGREEQPTSISEPASGPAPRVVLIDDHELVLEGLARLLGRGGLEVLRTFIRPEPALDFVASHDVDLVVVDLRLADQSGKVVVEALHRLRPAVQIAVLTSYADVQATSEVLRAGARGFLLKDTSSDELSYRLRSVAAGNLVVDSRVASALSQPPAITLSDQQRAILELAAAGLTNREIGAKLYISHYTVKDHLVRIMRKLGTSKRVETVIAAAEMGLLDRQKDD